MEIEQGRTYTCIKGHYALTVGRDYICVTAGGLFNDLGNRVSFGERLAEKIFKQAPTTEELLKRIKALEEANTDQTRPQEAAIYVPDGMLNRHCGIKKGPHCLLGVSGTWGVGYNPDSEPSTPKQFKLVPCDRKDLVPGDVAFYYLREDGLTQELSTLGCYSIVANEGLVSWDEEGIHVCNYELNDSYIWYKVIEA
jgi:hypothetical protein